MQVCAEDTANTYDSYRTRLGGRLTWHACIFKEVFDVTLKEGLRENVKQRKRQDCSKTEKWHSTRQKGWVSQSCLRFIQSRDKEWAPALLGKSCPQISKKKAEERHRQNIRSQQTVAGTPKLLPRKPKYHIYKVLQGLDKSKTFHSHCSTKQHR